MVEAPLPLSATQLDAIEDAREEANVLADRMEETYGLRFPSELPWVAGWLASLGPEEHRTVEELLGRLVGIGTWFLREPPRAPSGDERMRDRARDDPPELVPVFACVDGTRLGYWYLDPAAEPLCVVGRAGGELVPGPNLLLDALRERLELVFTPSREPLLDGIAAVRARMVEEGGVLPARRPGHRLELLGGPFARLRADVLPRTAQVRREAYRAESPDVEAWAAKVLVELERGAPLRALALGHELHAAHLPRWRLLATELLVRAYVALGRRAHAGTVRAMYLAEDPEGPVFALPPEHPLRTAGDAEEIRSALDAPGLETTDVEAALGSMDTDAIDTILAHPVFAAHRAAIDGAITRRLYNGFSPFAVATRRAKERGPFVRLVTRTGIGLVAFENVLRVWAAYPGEEVCALVAAHVDLEGDAALRLAERFGAVEAVKVLIERGAK